MKRLVFVTGRPGIGKTSVLLRAVDVLRGKGYKVGGMISREIRKQGVRVGFEIVDFHTGQRGWLAHITQPVGPQISKYRVNLSDLNVIGASAVINAATDADIIVVDEIGPMELFSPEFRKAVDKAIESGKPVVGTIHSRARDPLINAIITRHDTEIFEVTYENRESLHNVIIRRVVQSLEKPS